MRYPEPPRAYESATVKLIWLNSEVLTLSNLYSIKQRQGHATGLMRLACEYADKYAERIVLFVGQYGNTTGLDNAGLIRFYEGFGFKIVPKKKPDYIFMERVSQNLHGV